MLCAKCNKDNPADASFCEGCGAKLQLICSACKASVSPGAQYCKKCGTSLGSTKDDDSATVSSTKSQIRVAADGGASEAPDGERKTVTALFADIKGSTELMEDLDPEEARTIIDPALKLMIDAVRRYDGYVVQSTRDGIFALFGAPVAHEDHPQRSLYAALRMQEELRRYSEKVVAGGGIPIEARVGVNTGEVVVRSITTGAGQTEYTPIGHTTNLAARMQAVAPTGSIAISEQTRKFVDGYFALKALGPTRVKGVSEPTNIYEVTGFGALRTRLQRSAVRGLTKFVGREREMETLKHAAEQARAGRGQIVAAVAEPGVGKSRLLLEFKATSQADWMVLETFSVSHGKASAYLPVIDLLRNYFDISTTDDEHKRREKVAGKIAILDRSLEGALPYLFALLGIVEGNDPLAQMDGQVKRRRTLDAIKRILLRESLNHPLMVIFEDLHWIDEQTQELLNLLTDSIGTTKVLLLVNYRLEYSHQWGNKTYYTQLRLDPLGRESGEEMLSALLGDSSELLPLKQLIIERTEGTPFFIEEIVQALFEDGVLTRNGTVKLAKSMNAVKVPATVQAVLASRIDRLSAEEKELLQTLAVLGREFPLALVQHVIPRPDGELERVLLRLQAGEFIYEQVAADDVEYVFKHALTQEVAYNSLLIERRKLLHERAGEAVESMFSGQLDDHVIELANHYSHSANVSKAVEYLGRAGQQAMQRSAYADAISRLTDAIHLLETLPETQERIHRQLALHTLLGPMLIATKGNAAPEVEKYYARALELCRLMGEPPQLFPLLFGLRSFYLVKGKLQAAHQLGEQLLGLAESAQDTELLLETHLALGNTLFMLGEFIPAQANLDQGIILYNPHHHRSHAVPYGIDPGLLCLAFAARNLWMLGYADQALRRADDAMTLMQELSHPFSQAYGLIFAATLHQFLREEQATQKWAEAAIAVSAEKGFTAYEAIAIMFRAWALSERGQSEKGLAQMRQGLTSWEATGAELWRQYYLALLAEVYGTMGQPEHGLIVLAESLAVVDKNAERMWEAELYRLSGHLLLKQDHSNIAKARGCFQRAIETARSQRAKSLELRATMSLARLLAKQGHPDDARTMLADIYDWFTEGFDTADLKDAKSLLDELAN